MAYATEKLVVENSGAPSWGNHGQSHWTVSGFDTVADAEEYIDDRCHALYGYSASGTAFTHASGRIVVHMSCWNSCD